MNNALPPNVNDNYPEGFDSSCGLPAAAMRAAHLVASSMTGQRQWDVPCIAEAIIAGYKPDLDVAGQPKLAMTLLERKGLDTMNLIKAWLDGDRKTPFPAAAQEGVELYVMFASARRKGVQ